MAAESMDAEGSSARGPPWKMDCWRVDYNSNGYSTSRGSSSYTSTPGTGYSTPSTYTNTSGGFTFTFTPSPQSSSRGLDLMSCRDGDHSEKKLKSLLRDFCVARGDVSVLDRWLSEIMGASRLIVAADASETSLLQFAGSWVRALTGITESVRNRFLADMLSTVPDDDEERLLMHIYSPRFAETCIVKMLPFVDVLVARHSCRDTSSSCQIVAAAAGDNGAPAPAEKLRPLLGVREAVARASQDIRLSFYSTSSEEARRITDGIANLLLAQEAKLDEAIWSTMEEVRTRLLPCTEDDDLWWGSQTPQGSPGILKLTWATISYINLLYTHRATVHQIVEQAVQLRGYVPKIDSVSPWMSLMMETVLSLEEKLAEKSRSFQDQSFRFLLLINNSYYIRQQLHPTTSIFESHISDLARKIDNYSETYLQLSWAPVLLCLYNSAPLCLGRYLTPAKFESEFQKTYASQKLWKVPDPTLRRRLRVTVTEKVVSGFTKYLEYNNISPSRITPQDLMDMLQELFEG